MTQDRANGRAQYEELRRQHPVFYYRSVQIEETEAGLHITYCFEIPGLATFRPEWTFPLKTEAARQEIARLCQGQKQEKLEGLIFSLGLVELISYWKTCCPPKVILEAGCLTPEQQQWWKEQYYYGLGEFFYTNGIPLDLEGFMSLENGGAEESCIVRENTENNGSGENSTNIELQTGKKLDGYLIPVGGGKDSSVTMDLLQEYHDKSFCYMINGRGATLESARAAGFCEDRMIIAKRTLAPEMLELNRQGYLNGHTPFSAIVAFSSVLTAYLYGLRYVALSNEASANESTVAGSTVNHQYSKSFKFEEDFTGYEQAYIGSGVSYFSLLRPWSEYQIAAYFSGLEQYHKVFRSCNVGSKQDIWCGHCPKCLFVYLILSPFIRPEKLGEIFGRDMLADPKMLPLLEQLIGVTEEKPFECVGSRDEINTAICEAIAKMTQEGYELPLLFRHYQKTEQYRQYQERSREEQNPYRHFYEEENLVPEHLQARLRQVDWSAMTWKH